jgi:hypothetical protein
VKPLLVDPSRARFFEGKLMDPECQLLLTLFARRLPQARITLITLKHHYLFNLFIANERVTHCIVLGRVHLPSMTQVADFIEETNLAVLIELSPVALRLNIPEETSTSASSARI